MSPELRVRLTAKNETGRYRGLILANGGSQEQADRARYIEELAERGMEPGPRLRV